MSVTVHYATPAEGHVRGGCEALFEEETGQFVAVTHPRVSVWLELVLFFFFLEIFFCCIIPNEGIAYFQTAQVS